MFLRRRRLRCIVLMVPIVLVGQWASGQSAEPGAVSHSPTTPAAIFAEEPNWQAVCAEALATPLPPEAATLATEASTQSAPADGPCDEQTLYYGFQKEPDYGAALHCAYRSRANPSATSGGFLDGAGTLAMLYANGDAVPRSYKLAIRFACELNGRGGQNTEQRIGRLEALRDGKLPARTRFDLCDEQMSGVMQAYCSELEGKQGDVGRARRVAAAEKRLPEQARAMLQELQTAETIFEKARRHGEYTGGGGSGSAGFTEEDQSKLREQFVINLERFAARNLPKATPAERQQAHRELDGAYGKVQAMPPPDPNGARVGSAPPTPAGFEATQNAWLKLFEAWMRFVPVAYPELSRDAAETELLRLRIHQLKAIAR